MKSTRGAIVVLFVFASSAFLFAAQQTLRTEVNLVSVYLTVRDNKGRLVTSLWQDDFKVLEDGKPERITHFSQNSDVPLNVGVLLDTRIDHWRIPFYPSSDLPEAAAPHCP